MAVGTTTMAIIGAVTAVASTAASVYASYEQQEAQRQAAEQEEQAARAQAQYQQDMAEYNAKIAETNAERVEEEGRALKRDAYDNSVRKRQEAQQIIGQQRALQSASGAVVDAGSNLDLNLDTAEKGEIDAFHLREQGAWQDYNKRVEAWNYRQQAAEAETDRLSQSYIPTQSYTPLIGKSTTSLLKGLNDTASTFGKLME